MRCACLFEVLACITASRIQCKYCTLHLQQPIFFCLHRPSGRVTCQGNSGYCPYSKEQDYCQSIGDNVCSSISSAFPLKLCICKWKVSRNGVNGWNAHCQEFMTTTSDTKRDGKIEGKMNSLSVKLNFHLDISAGICKLFTNPSLISNLKFRKIVQQNGGPR